MSTEDYTVSASDAIARLATFTEGEGADERLRVHTFRSMAFGLVGADWDLSDVEALIEERGVEVSGDQATAMGHGLVVLESEPMGPLFLATRSDET